MMQNSESISTLLNATQLAERVRQLGQTISQDYQHVEPLFIGVLKGSFVFLADLIRCIQIPCQVEFLSASSYGLGQVSQGVVQIQHALSLKNRHVILVEDILDSGLTLNQIALSLLQQQPASLKGCVMFDKGKAPELKLDVPYRGFQIADDFVVGYGLDYQNHYRHLPYLARILTEA